MITFLEGENAPIISFFFKLSVLMYGSRVNYTIHASRGISAKQYAPKLSLFIILFDLTHIIHKYFVIK